MISNHSPSNETAMELTDEPLKIAVCINSNQWHLRFLDALESIARSDSSIRYSAVEIDANDWSFSLASFDVILWKPKSMGFEAASYFKEKIFYLEKMLGKLVVPNFDTIWHFDSKVCQEYIFRDQEIKRPRTVASFDYLDALSQLERFDMPLVFKRPNGAGSSNVKLVTTKAAAVREIKRIFCKDVVQRDMEQKGKIAGKLSRHYLNLRNDRKTNATNHPVVYWQEFIAGNSRDLRITVIGDKYAFGFWRNNRKNDFRASGSGDIDYQTPVPENVLLYCMSLSKRLNFDSMAYDIVFRGDDFLLVEMSYGYVDKAIHRASGYFELVGGQLLYRPGQVWPQTLWVYWAIERYRSQRAGQVRSGAGSHESNS